MWEFMSHTCDAIIGLYAADAHVGLNHPMNGSLLLSYPQTSTAWWVSCALTCCQHTHTHTHTHTAITALTLPSPLPPSPRTTVKRFWVKNTAQSVCNANGLETW